MSITTFTRYGAVAALFVVPLMGCERRERVDSSGYTEPAPVQPKTEQPSNPTPMGGGPLAINAAVDQIAQARCAREQKCGNLGADKKYSDGNSCLTETRRDFAEDLNADDCPAGVDQKELQECMQEIQNEDCGNPFDTLGRLAACRTSDLCRHVK